MKKLLPSLFIFTFSLFTCLCFAQTGKWSAVRAQAPHYNMGVCLLMTNGTVICHNSSDGGDGRGWDRLTPDIHGSYANGTWDTIAPNYYDRLFFSSQVLPSGKVYVAGGEYGAGTNMGEVYDPATNTWGVCDTIPAGWKIYDGNSEILYDGTVLEGPQIGSAWSYNTLIWSPVTNAYTVYPNSIYNHDEASWLKLPDSSVLFVGINSTGSNRFIPQTGTWINDGTVPGMLYDPFGSEAGQSFMLPNGKAYFTGATGFNTFYTPSGNTNPGTWTIADSFPMINGVQVACPDASGAMMVNGKILISVSPIGESGNEFRSPTWFVEYDYKTNTFAQVLDTIPFLGVDSIAGLAAYQTQMLDLPDGTVLVSISQSGLSNQYYIYTPGSGPIPQGKPTINKILPAGCPKYKITGKLFNGISEGASFGDDWQMETNYPVIRLTNGTKVYYATTSNWNRIGAVQTDSLEDTAYFTLPASLPAGTYSLVLTANGFASNPVIFTTLQASASESNVDCMGGTGNATAFGIGGISPYTYKWAPGGQTTAGVTGMSAGTYTVSVTDKNGCSTMSLITITQPAALTALIDSVDVSSLNACDGSAKVIPGGGTAPYTYKWTSGGQTNDTINNQCAGNYCCVVTDKPWLHSNHLH